MSSLVLTTIQDRVSSDSHTVTEVFSGWTKIITQSADNDANIEFTATYITSDYDKYCFVLENMRPANDADSLYCRISQGAVFKTDSTYHFHSNRCTSGVATYLGSSDTAFGSMILGTSIGNDANSHADGLVFLIKPANTATYPALFWNGQNFKSTSVAAMMVGCGHYSGAVGACDGVRFYFSTGNIVDGSITLYGIK